MIKNDLILLQTAGLIVIKNNKLLLAYSNNKKAWYLPGGKIDPEEDSLESLKREILEELNLVLDSKRLNYYCHITAPAYGEAENVIMEQECYIYELEENICPSNEIGAIRFVDHRSYRLEKIQVVGVLKVFQKLEEDQLLF